MEYGKIVSVTGLPGLFELVSSKNDGAIVRSLDDKSTKFVSSRIHNFSHLESIEIYTVRDNVNLVEVFKAMEAGSDKLPDGKDNGALKKYFEKVFPDMDFERVYSSDMKKIVKWFTVLTNNQVEIKLRELPEEPAEEDAAEEEAPAKAAAKKEKAATPDEDTEVAEAPAKPKKTATKAAAKKEKAEDAGEEAAEKPKKKAAPKAKKEDDGAAKEPAKKKAAPAEKKPKK
ncbi:MAG: DUF5606 domain-containing protein [Candidatus Pseudobacter hemicellulosilyticus]|uniref:DUF5606 domain-containing protein n=1 Tax=Candidatus Pseudobacter hemicellulosilyticus TaxID=3121375 RepID=A0AAJ6BGM2_9BACT|nr:MAG: DUF5606 domain-containing protein [Pseudobacter sp.]